MRARICSMTCSTFTESERTLKSAINSFQSRLSALRSEQWTADSRERPCKASKRTVDDQGNGERPQGHARKQRAVRQEQIGGAPDDVPMVHQIEDHENSVSGQTYSTQEP